MPGFDTEKEFDTVKQKVLDAYKDALNLKTDKHEVKVEKIYIKDTKESDDISGQKRAILKGESWQVPIKADLVLYENGKRKESVKDVTVGNLPKLTDRLGYIVNGNEFQSATLLRLRPGVYHRRAQNDALLAEFNLGNRDQFIKGKSLKVDFNPETAEFNLLTANRKIPLLPLLYDAGMTDKDLEKIWGKQILQRNKEMKRSSIKEGRKKLVDLVKGKNSEESGIGLFQELMDKTELDPETTKVTLGKPFKKVTPEALALAGERLIRMSKGEDEGDDRGDLGFLSVHSAEDLIANRIKSNAYKAKSKMRFQLERRKKSLKDSVPTKVFDNAIKGFFNTSLARQGDQTNPLEFLTGHRKTTVMGEQGGIQSSFAVLEDSKLVNQTHFGFLDPVDTPEGEKTGVTLALSMAAEKEGNRLKSKFINNKTGKHESLTPSKAMEKVVGLPDQFKITKSGVKPVAKKVQAIKDGELVTIDADKVDYVLPSPRGVFGVGANLVPFLQNNQGNRAMTAARQQQQASPLKYREAPLVQVLGDKDKTFEEIFGQFASSKATVSGTVTKVTKDHVFIKSGRKTTKVPLYNNFPLKGHSLYHSEVKVKKGDKVNKGDLLADTTFTKDGKLALGTNLRTAYMPFKGYNFEDGVIISETGAKKLTSEHIYPKNTNLKGDVITKKNTFLNEHPYVFRQKQVKNIDEDGIIRVGSKVEPGDPLILKMKKPELSQYMSKRRKFGGRSLKYRDKSMVWKKDTPGVVTDIVKKRDGEVIVYVKTEEAAVQGDKIVGRHGNKGIITRVIPDNEMPYKVNEKGEKERVDIVLNPMGVPGRINLGQVLETVAGKVAEKDGEVYKVRNFEAGKDYLTELKKEIKSKGIEDKERLINPDTGKPYDQKILEGQQYIFKLKHKVDKKMSARSGGPGAAYNINHAPTGSSDNARGNTLGELGLFAMLAHGSRKNIHEMFTYKSDQTDGLWDALREGTPLPPPKVPFAFEKFLGYMNAMRVNVKKEGNSLQLVPFTEEQLTGKEGLSNGEITKPGELIRGKNLKEINGGLFDPEVTGGINGVHWSHVKLGEEIPNPLFEDAIVKLLDLKRGEFDKYISGEKKYKGKRGGAAIKEMLGEINLKDERAKLEKAVRAKKKSGKDKALKKLKIVRALQEADLTPDVYMMKSLPILPPHFRPITVKDNGDLSTNDLNGLYKDVGAINDLITVQKNSGIPDAKLKESREELYQGVKAIMGLGGSLTRQGQYRGIIDLISGKSRDSKGKTSGGSSKGGYFHKELLKRRQDFSARSTIIPEPRMGLDEVGLPEDMAWKLYEPFIQRKLLQTGYSIDEAETNYKEKTPIAKKALKMVVEDRPVLVKRDPALHKFNIMAFKPRLVKGKAIEIHPLTVSGYNADFDGDTMAVFLPITKGAVKEAYNMFPSNNLFSETNGRVQYVPGHEALMGMYLASQVGKKTNKKFKTVAEAERAYKRGTIDLTDRITVNGTEVTLGKMRIESALPKELRELGKKPLEQTRVYGKKDIGNILTTVAKKHPKKFGLVANKFKDLGNDYSTKVGFSIGLDDFSTVNKELRDTLIREANQKADHIRGSKQLSANQKYAKIVETFQAVDEKLDKANSVALRKDPTNIYKMVVSGARGKPEQLKQIVSSPILVKDGRDRVVPYLIPKSYSEGMDLGSYWTTMHGARKGTIQKVQGVRDPGYISKQIQHSVMNTVITEPDCGTQEGIFLSIDDADITDRRLASNSNFKGVRLRRNELVTANTISAAKKAGRSRIKVRTALRCESKNGVCQMCAGDSIGGGRMDVGTNIGVISGHAIGEPSVQLSLNVFHTGGLAKGKAAKSQSTFKILSNFMRLPQNFPDAAVLSPTSGVVKDVEAAPQGGSFVTVGKSKTYVPATRDLTVKKGMEIQKGEPLSDGSINPVDLLSKTNITKTQDQLTHDIHSLFGSVSPIRRRNVEVVVKAMTNVTKIEDPATHPRYLPGDMAPASEIRAWNKKHKGKEIKHTPVIKGVNVLPHSIHEDWMARLGYDNIGRTLVEASREGWKTNIHGFHPIPAAAYAKEFGIKSKIGVEDWKGQY